jgi:hypothetical protein
MLVDYKVKKYNFKIINAIKKNYMNKIPEYLHHISFYLKENLNNNNFIGGRPKEDGDLDSTKISSELDNSLQQLKSIRQKLLEKKKSEEEHNATKIREIEKKKNDELCKTKEEYYKQINKNNLEIDVLKKDNQLKLIKIHDLEQQLVSLQSSNSSENQKISAELQQNKSIIELNKLKIIELDEKNLELTQEIVDLHTKLEKTQDSRQSNYAAGLSAIKKFRVLTEELAMFEGMENLSKIFGFDIEKLTSQWGLSKEAAEYVLGTTIVVPLLPVIEA